MLPSLLIIHAGTLNRRRHQLFQKIAPKSSGNAITNFIRQEITAPEKRAGNTSIAISLTVFGLAVTFLRSLGDMLGV
ncbi:hypothetical protein BGX27_005995 [Mortierella sp. AM989]|nr:hypothetical protein BGX27_005995 [Mortierella sp. AM989]